MIIKFWKLRLLYDQYMKIRKQKKKIKLLEERNKYLLSKLKEMASVKIH
jgi:hypothetical protein